MRRLITIFARAFSFLAEYLLFACGNLVHTAADFAQVSFVAARQFHCQVSAESDLSNRFADFFPINAAFAQRNPLAAFVLEILEMEFDDAFPARAITSWRKPVHYDFADKKIAFAKGVFNFVLLFGGVVRTQQNFFPAGFDPETPPHLWTRGNEFFVGRLRPPPP